MTEDITISFPANRHDIAKAIGEALMAIGSAPGASGGLKTYTEEEEAEMFGGGQAQTTEEDGTAPAEEDGASLAADANSHVDLNDVPFNAEFCGKAKEPFYASGKNKGQWKKRKGVSDEAYENWYASAQPATNTAAPAAEAEVNTAAAFAGSQPQTQEVDESVPTDCGSFMGWVSAQQAAGLLTQDHVTQAYQQLGLQVTSLFPPNDPATIAQHVAALHAALAPMVQA